MCVCVCVSSSIPASPNNFVKQLSLLPTCYSKPLKFHQQTNKHLEGKAQKGNEILFSVCGYIVESATGQVSFDVWHHVTFFLTFIGLCIVSIFQYISKKIQLYTVYLYLEIALHVSGGTSTHHQERIQLCLQHLVFVTPLLLSSAIVEELELVWVWCGWRTPPTAHSNRFQLFHDSGR